MRRLWAYIIVIFTALVAVFASFPALMRGVKTNGEFITRRQFTFQLVEREQSDDDIEPKKLESYSAREVATIMESRLGQANVTSYDISTSGNDIITVSFNANNDDEYKQIITYLAFSGSFALVNESNDVVAGEDFIRGKAYTKDYEVNEYPTVIIPVKTDSPDYEALIEHAKEKPVSTGSGEEGEEGETVARIYLLYNWQKGETYNSLTEQQKLESKTLFTIDFDPDSEEGLYYDSNKNSFSRVSGFQDKNGNGVADEDEVRAAYAQADYLVNLFSASEYDYEVKCIRGLTDETSITLEPKTEYLLDDNHRLVWNRTLTAVVAGIVVVTLLLAFFYRLGALSAATSTLVTVFFAVLVMIKTGLEYNVLGVVGLVAVALLALASNIIYLSKLKEDCYKGHTLKKANTEASKKSLLPILDIHFVALAIGVMLYVLGGSALRTFSAVLGIGAIISAIINTLGLKGVMWLVTNATALNGRYDLFDVKAEYVPDHTSTSEDKPKYKGVYEGKEFGKHKKAIAISTLVAFVASVAGMIVAGSLRGGELLKKPSVSSLGSEIYVQNRIIVKDDDESPLNDTSLESILDSILIQKSSKTAIDQDDPSTYVTLSSYVEDKKTFAISETKIVDTVSRTYLDTYYTLTLNANLKGTEIAEIKGEPTPVDPQTLTEVMEVYFETTLTFSTSESNSIELKQIKTIVNSTNTKWDKILLGTSIAILICTAYLMLRYRLTRGIASLLFPTVSMAITFGLLLFINLFVSVPANAFIAVPMVPLFTYFFMILFFNKERELLLDDKVKDNTVEHRQEVAKRAIGIAYAPILATAVVGIYCLINFFGFGPNNMYIAYVASFIGAIITLALVSTLIVPACNVLFRWFSKVKIERKAPKAKKSKKPVHKSAEPEEAIFIGIND